MISKFANLLIISAVSQSPLQRWETASGNLVRPYRSLPVRCGMRSYRMVKSERVSQKTKALRSTRRFLGYKLRTRKGQASFYEEANRAYTPRVCDETLKIHQEPCFGIRGVV